MMSLNKPIIIAPDEFDAHFQKHLERRNARMWEGEPIDPEELQFMQDGDIDKYIDSMLASGKHLSPAFSLRGCYPFSELEDMVHHTLRLWSRVVESPAAPIFSWVRANASLWALRRLLPPTPR